MFQQTEKIHMRIFNKCPDCNKEWESDIEIEKEIYDLMNWTATMSQYVFCDTCKAKHDAINQQEQRKKDIADEIDFANIPKEFISWDRDLGNIELCKWIKANADKSLIICGEYGTGKTRSICVNLCNLIKENLYQRLKIKYYRFPDLAKGYAGICHTDISQAKNYLMNIFRNDIVVIDDLVKQRITDNAGEMLYEVFDMLYNGNIQCRIWFTSNIDWRKLAIRFENHDVGNAVVSRIDRMISDGRMVYKQN
jgi:DNA replication protein DnaC